MPYHQLTLRKKSSLQKLLKLLKALIAFNEEESLIDRDQLRRIIIGELDVFDRHQISAWINKLLYSNILIQNPSSNLSKHKQIKMPTLNTKYVIDSTIIYANYVALKDFLES